MEDLQSFSKNKKNIWVSTTGYRTLLILRLLLQQERTLDELISLLKEDMVVQKAISKDTIRVAINTLRKVGCVIPRPERANDYKYKIVSHPFVLSLSKEQIKAFLKLRDILCEDYDWKKILLINDLYEKIFSLANDSEQVEMVRESKLLSGIDKDLLLSLSNHKLIDKKITIEYKSVKVGIEDIEVVPKKFLYQNGKLYLVCYNFKYFQNSILNVERITKIKSINLEKTYEDVGVYEVVYKVNNESFKSFELKENEQIIEKAENSLTVKAKVMDEFLFIQRILLFGVDFEIIAPDFFKEKLIDKLKLLKRGYENE